MTRLLLARRNVKHCGTLQRAWQQQLGPGSCTGRRGCRAAYRRSSLKIVHSAMPLILPMAAWHCSQTQGRLSEDSSSFEAAEGSDEQ